MRHLLQISDKMYCQVFLEVRRPAFNKHLLVKSHQWNHKNNLWILLKVCYHDISPTISRTKSHCTNWVGFSKWSWNRNLFPTASMRQWVVYDNTFNLRSTDFYLQCRLYSNWNGGAVCTLKSPLHLNDGYCYCWSYFPQFFSFEFAYFTDLGHNNISKKLTMQVFNSLSSWFYRIGFLDLKDLKIERDKIEKWMNKNELSSWKQNQSQFDRLFT